MTTTKHYLQLDRLVVSRSGCSVYDEKYHPGVNIVRSDINACGKSSIMDFIHYALGGEVSRWRIEQKQCDYVYADVIVNGKLFCLRREIHQGGIAPTFVSDLPYHEAINSQEWTRFGHRRSPERQSFSQWFFDQLSYPIYKIDADSNLTMHQLLRLMYFDQQTSDSDLIRPEQRFDNAITRQAIGDFLLGLDNLEYSRVKQEYLATVKKSDEIMHDIKSIYTVLGVQSQDMKIDSIKEKILRLEENIAVLRTSASMVEKEDVGMLAEEQRLRVIMLQDKINVLSREISWLQSRCTGIDLEIEDNIEFIATLRQRIKSINDSLAAREALMSVSFEYCPLCLTPLDPQVGTDRCPLCKHECDQLDTKSHGHLRMAMEMEFQIKETISVTDDLAVEKASVRDLISSKSQELDSLTNEYHSVFGARSISESKLLDLARQIGVCEAKIESEQRNFELAAKLASLLDRRNSLFEAISVLENDMLRLEAANFERKQYVISRLEALTCELVKLDTGTETNFINPTSFHFDFAKNSFSINNAEKISESSNVILKSSFALSMLLESTTDELYKLPRFIILDQTEGQGMVLERRHRFQETIINSCQAISGHFQVIFTTSSLDPRYEGSSLCVGPCYTGSMKTLDFSRCAK